MLSNKLTFSLTSLIVCLMFAFVTTAMGNGDHHFSASLLPGELMVDVSTTDHAGIEDIQVRSHRDRAVGYAEAADPGLQLDFIVQFGKVVRLYDFTLDSVTSGTIASSGGALGLDDFTVEAFDDLKRSLGVIPLHYVVVTTAFASYAVGDIIPPGTTGVVRTGNNANVDPIASLEFSTPQVVNVRDPGELPGQQFRLEIFYEALRNAYDATTGGEFEIHTLLIQLGHNKVVDASLGIRQDFLADDKADIAHNEGPKLLRVDLVDEDEGDARYARITGATSADPVGDNAPLRGGGATIASPVNTYNAVDTNNSAIAASIHRASSGVPGVVAIQRTLPTSGIAAIATGPFDVRIVLTEEPASFTAANLIVLNGTASDPVPLLPIPAGGLRADNFPGLRYTDINTTGSNTNNTISN